MGQQVVTLMYGISSKTPGLTVGEDGEYFWDDYQAPEEKRLHYKQAPRHAYEGGVVGFAVAAGPGQDNGEGYLGETTLVADIETTHREHIEKAKAKWASFAAWAERVHGKTLPKAQLWLTTDERA